MRNPLIRRALYSFLLTLAGLSLIYSLIAVVPNPRMWMANATANSGMMVQALVLLIIYGIPAWAVAYVIFGLLGIPNVERRNRSDRTPPTG